MFKELILKFKIKKAEKKLLKLKQLKNMKLDLSIIENEIKRLNHDLYDLDSEKYFEQQNKMSQNSIFDRCSKCNTLYIKDQGHNC